MPQIAKKLQIFVRIQLAPVLKQHTFDRTPQFVPTLQILFDLLLLVELYDLRFGVF